MRKTLKEYIIENKKVYSFKVKLAGEFMSDFEEKLKETLSRCNVLVLKKIKSTPVQKVPLDFPNLSNMEVTIYDLVCEYPITPPEIMNELKGLGIDEEYVIVRNSSEPTEVDELLTPDHEGKALLTKEVEEPGIDHKEVYGAEYNTGFLADLAKAAKERKEKLGHNENANPDVLGTQEKFEQDKAGTKSAVGSK